MHPLPLVEAVQLRLAPLVVMLEAARPVGTLGAEEQAGLAMEIAALWADEPKESTAATVKEMDSNASLSRSEANKANQGQLTPEQMAYDLEVFARGFENLSQAGHFKKPLYVGAPTSQPTTLPWTPTGGTNPNP